MGWAEGLVAAGTTKQEGRGQQRIPWTPLRHSAGISRAEKTWGGGCTVSWVKEGEDNARGAALLPPHKLALSPSPTTGQR
jgi:hypothetical protein